MISIATRDTSAAPTDSALSPRSPSASGTWASASRDPLLWAYVSHLTHSLTLFFDLEQPLIESCLPTRGGARRRSGARLRRLLAAAGAEGAVRWALQRPAGARAAVRRTGLAWRRPGQASSSPNIANPPP